MDIHFDLITFMHLLAAVLGVLVSCVLWHSGRSQNLAFNHWLGGSIFSLALGFGISFVLMSGMGDHFPHVYRVGNFFALLYMPLSYLYMRKVTTRQSTTWRDLLHLLPAMFYFVDFLPFFLLSTEAKQIILQNDLGDFNNAMSYDEGWITPPYAQLVIRTFQFFVYWLLQVRLLRRIYQIDISKLEPQGKTWLQWASINTGIQTLFFLPSFMVWFFNKWAYLFLSANALVSVALIFSALVLFFRPDILYGIKGLIVNKQEEKSDSAVSTIGEEPVNNHHQNGIYIDFETLHGIQTKLDVLMRETAPFRKHGYSSADLAKDLDIPPYQLSAFLNQNLGTNFNDFINEHRIRYCIEHLEKGDWKKLTIEGIGYECGFNNRNTFTLAFKKYTGKTPSTYIRNTTANLPII